MPLLHRSGRSALVWVGIGLALVAAAGCGGTGPEANSTNGLTASTDTSATLSAPAEQRFPDVVAVEISRIEGDIYDLAVTLSSPYDTPERYADGWRVLTPDGTMLGEHVLGHDHANEQPFTRNQTGLRIPDDVENITVEGRDQVNGYGGGTIEVEVPREPAS